MDQRPQAEPPYSNPNGPQHNHPGHGQQPGYQQGPHQQGFQHPHQQGYQQPPYANQPQYNEMYSSNDKTTSLIVCCLGFLGFAGIHRMMSGHVLLGVLYFFTGGLCYIGTIIDIVSIANGSYRDSEGRLLRPN